MYPELFRIGDFPITSYGIWLAAGMLLALFVASRLAARDGLPRERIYDLGLWTLLGGLLGLLLAWGVTALITALASITMTITIGYILLAILVSTALGLVA